MAAAQLFLSYGVGFHLPDGASASMVQAMGSCLVLLYVRPKRSVTFTVILLFGLLATALNMWVLALVALPSP